MNDEIKKFLDDENMEGVSELWAQATDEEKKYILDYKDKTDDSALMIASFQGNTQMVQYILDEMENLGASKEELLEEFQRRYTGEFTLLMTAAKGGHIETVKYILRKMEELGASGADRLSNLNMKTDEADDGDTALEVAADEGHIDIVLYIFDEMKVLGANDADRLEAVVDESWSGQNVFSKLLKRVDLGSNVIHTLLDRIKTFEVDDSEKKTAYHKILLCIARSKTPREFKIFLDRFASDPNDKRGFLMKDNKVLINTLIELDEYNKDTEYKVELCFQELLDQSVPITTEDINNLGASPIRVGKSPAILFYHNGRYTINTGYVTAYPQGPQAYSIHPHISWPMDLWISRF